MRMIIKQNFEQILNYKYDPDFMRENVQVFMRFTKGDMQERNLSEVLKFTFNEKKRSSEAVYFGRMNFLLMEEYSVRWKTKVNQKQLEITMSIILTNSCE